MEKIEEGGKGRGGLVGERRVGWEEREGRREGGKREEVLPTSLRQLFLRQLFLNPLFFSLEARSSTPDVRGR